MPLLAAHFVIEFARRMGKNVDRIGSHAAARLAAYAWPGNVRELANVIERAVILCEGPVIHDEHIGALIAGPQRVESDVFPTLDEMERQHIQRALAKTGGVLAGPQGAAQTAGHAAIDRLVEDAEARHPGRAGLITIKSCCRYFGTAAEVSARPASLQPPFIPHELT